MNDDDCRKEFIQKILSLTNGQKIQWHYVLSGILIGSFISSNHPGLLLLIRWKNIRLPVFRLKMGYSLSLIHTGIKRDIDGYPEEGFLEYTGLGETSGIKGHTESKDDVFHELWHSICKLHDEKKITVEDFVGNRGEWSDLLNTHKVDR